MAEAKTQKTKAPAPFIRMLKQAMEEHPEKLSLRQVAKRADISASYLSLLISGDRGVPSNEAIAQLERVLKVPEGDLFKAAARPDSQALEFFRKDEAGSIMRTLAPLPDSQLSQIRKMIERFVARQGAKHK